MAEKGQVRHPVAEANEQCPFGSLSASEFYERHSVIHSSSSFVNPQSLKIFTQSWIPKTTEAVKGVICVVHGFTGESNWFVQLTSVLFAESGFAVCALDHQGHGFSDGLPSHIPDIHPVVRDCITFFDSFRSQYPNSTPCFLYSESLGGAIALLIHLIQDCHYHPAGDGVSSDDRDNSRSGRPWSGIVLNGAMCGISDKIKPPWPLEHLLSLAAFLVPTWKIVPTRGTIVDVSFKLEWKRKLAMASPRRQMAGGRPRAATALELIRVCRELQGKFEEITVPLLMVHGSEDVLCDPACIEELYRRASSKDKTIKLYPGMWHQLVGESDEDVNLVFSDVLQWLISRSNSAPNDNNDDSSTQLGSD